MINQIVIDKLDELSNLLTEYFADISNASQFLNSTVDENTTPLEVLAVLYNYLQATHQNKIS